MVALDGDGDSAPKAFQRPEAAPGSSQSRTDHSSVRRFSTGVPVRATRAWAGMLRSDLAVPDKRVLGVLGFVGHHHRKTCLRQRRFFPA